MEGGGSHRKEEGVKEERREGGGRDGRGFIFMRFCCVTKVGTVSLFKLVNKKASQ